MTNKSTNEADKQGWFIEWYKWNVRAQALIEAGARLWISTPTGIRLCKYSDTGWNSIAALAEDAFAKRSRDSSSNPSIQILCRVHPCGPTPPASEALAGAGQNGWDYRMTQSCKLCYEVRGMERHPRVYKGCGKDL
jgi:hypothetical protein